MSEENEQTETKSELDLLKTRARMMGITFSNNISVDTLRAKINEKLNEGEEEAGENDSTQPEDQNDESASTNSDSSVDLPDPVAPTAEPEVNPLSNVQTEVPKKEKPKSLRQQLYEENMRMVRCRITNLDPKKSNLPGELIAVGNEILGMVKRFVPYGEATDEGWHIPYIIYKTLAARKFLDIRTTKNAKSKREETKTRWVREFAIEILPPLSQEELGRLATAQLANGLVEEPDALMS